MNILRCTGRGWYAAALAILTGCSSGGSALAPVGGITVPAQAARGLASDSPAALPVIKRVTKILPQQTQTIRIIGTGFGAHKPYNGTTLFLEISDVTGRWAAGYGHDAVSLNVTHWTNTKITIAGFTGAYGQNNWTLNSGDKILVLVWNPQTKKGPAKHRAVVK